MQNRFGLIAGAIVVIVILAVVGYTQFGKKTSQSPGSVPQQQEQSGISATKASIKSLLGGGKNVTCDITYPENGGTGKIFVSNDKMRGDFNTVVEGKTYNSSVIHDGEYAYIWSADTSQGTKVKLDKSLGELQKDAKDAQKGQAADLDKQVDLNCSNWSVDSSKFTPPAEVTFTDVTAQTEQLKQLQQQPGGSPAQDTKSACDQITDPQAKAACLQYSGSGQ